MRSFYIMVYYHGCHMKANIYNGYSLDSLLIWVFRTMFQIIFWCHYHQWGFPYIQKLTCFETLYNWSIHSGILNTIDLSVAEPLLFFSFLFFSLFPLSLIIAFKDVYVWRISPKRKQKKLTQTPSLAGSIVMKMFSRHWRIAEA